MMWRSSRKKDRREVASSDEMPPDLLGEFIESLVSWREEAAAVRSAYDAWRTAIGADEVLAFATYRAALEREEFAANVLRTWAQSMHEEFERALATTAPAAGMTRPSLRDCPT
jgi:hypothetical protein